LQYLNSGPGGIAGAFIHNRHVGAKRTYFAGWWGVKLDERFKMDHIAEFMPGWYKDGAN
jgi:kynureninase